MFFFFFSFFGLSIYQQLHYILYTILYFTHFFCLNYHFCFFFFIKKNDKQIIKLASEIAPSVNSGVAIASSGKKWRVGDYCLGVWLEDGNYYDAKIDSVSDDNTVTITYLDYGNSAPVSVNSLREMPAASVEKYSTKRTLQESEEGGEGTGSSGDGDGNGDGDGDGDKGGEGSSASSSSSATASAQHIVKKPKTATSNVNSKAVKDAKLQKMKERKQKSEEITKEKEQQQKGWQSFASKSKAVPKKSIFASPSNPNGKVGFGTCGVGGKPPTENSKTTILKKDTAAALDSSD